VPAAPDAAARRGLPLRTGVLAWLLCAGAALAALAPRAAAGEPAAPGPRDLIGKAVDEVVAVLRDAELSDGQKRAAVEQVVGRETDIETISALVLAKHHKKFDEGQKARFAEQFRTHLVLTYWKNAAHLLFERIDVTDDREEARGDWSVTTKVIAPSGSDVKIEYRMRRNDDGRWLIIDIIIEGVSMVSNFRSQFQEVLSNGTPERLLELLTEKNAAAEEDFAAPAEG
jgi:phospholipid transport system substrate-binding protein